MSDLRRRSGPRNEAAPTSYTIDTPIVSPAADSGELPFDEAARHRDGILALIADDPRNKAHVKAIVETIMDVVPPGGTLSSNRIRPYLPHWIRTQVIGPTFGMLRKRGAIELVGWEPSTSRNTHNKPVGLYRRTAR